MNFVVGEPHIVASMSCISAALEIIKILPESDLILQAGETLSTAMEILIDYCEKESMSNEELYRMMECSDEIKSEIKRLYAANKK